MSDMRAEASPGSVRGISGSGDFEIYCKRCGRYDFHFDSDGREGRIATYFTLVCDGCDNFWRYDVRPEGVAAGVHADLHARMAEAERRLSEVEVVFESDAYAQAVIRDAEAGVALKEAQDHAAASKKRGKGVRLSLGR